MSNSLESHDSTGSPHSPGQAPIPHVAIEQLDKSISEVFALMLNRSCNPAERCPTEDPAHSSPESREHRPGLTASISFSGSLRGACTLHLPLRTATALTEELVGPMPEDEAATLNADTAGEICNMIAGSWKSRQQDANATCLLSVPAITQATPSETATHREAIPASFRNHVTRVYAFEDHCLHLKLAFD